MVEKSSGSDSAIRRLQCEAEGHPLPNITWLSASRSPLRDQVQTSVVDPYRLVSSVPYLEEDVFSCRVESSLGGAERRYPASKTLMITLTVCGLIVLLLLSTGFVYYMRNRGELQVKVHQLFLIVFYFHIINHIYSTSAVPVWNRMITWPPALLIRAFSRTTHPNNFTFATALPCWSDEQLLR